MTSEHGHPLEPKYLIRLPGVVPGILLFFVLIFHITKKFVARHHGRNEIVNPKA